MKNQELFDRTVAILVKAYQSDTLAHGDCTACAVGNLICANMFKGDFNTWYLHYEDKMWECGNWNDLFCTYPDGQEIKLHRLGEGSIMKQVGSTGYHYDDLARIEFAFESAETGGVEKTAENGSDEVWMFNGLMSVIDTLMQIHEATTEETESAKLLFVKQ